MASPLTRAAVVLASVLSGGCGLVGPEVCTDDLSWSVTPTEASLTIGESFTAQAEAFGCGGGEPLEEDLRWSSEDPQVATVDEITGRVTAEGAGATRIIGEDVGRYGIGPVEIPVTVEP